MSLSVLHFVTYVRENMSTMAVSMPLVEHHDVDYHFVVEEKVAIDNVLVATRRRGQTQSASCYGLEDIRSISRVGGFVTWLAAASVTWGGLSCQDFSACKGGFQGLEQPEQFQAGWWQCVFLVVEWGRPVALVRKHAWFDSVGSTHARQKKLCCSLEHAHGVSG